MSEVAGRMAVQVGAQLPREAGTAAAACCSAACRACEPAHVVVLGGGIVGQNAAKVAVGLGAQRHHPRHQPRPHCAYLDDVFAGRVATVVLRPRTTSPTSCARPTCVVGAVLIPGAQGAEARHRASWSRR